MGNVSADLGKVHPQITDESISALQRYRNVVLGPSKVSFLLRYELITLICSGMHGAIGLWLRKTLYRYLLRSVGPGSIIGRNVVLRHPKKVILGDNVIIDDDCVLDARGNANHGIIFGNDVMLARNVTLGCKNGNISLGNGVSFGAHSTIHAFQGSDVSVGNNVVAGAYTHLVAGSNYNFDRTDIPIARQGINIKGGICVEDNVWLGARATILDGVTVGRDAIIGTGAVVTKDVPAFAISVGVPAKVIGTR